MRKRRTRSHIIEDLGFNHVERQVLLAGFTTQKFNFDYGYDSYIHTYKQNGEYENGEIIFQLKSTDNIRFSEKKQGFIYDLSVRDLELWLLSQSLMLIILYDSKINQAYFVDLKDYFQKNSATLKNLRRFVRIFIPQQNLIEPNSIEELRKLKNSEYGTP
jgi:Domain of unknown function (DUF4365)